MDIEETQLAELNNLKVGKEINNCMDEALQEMIRISVLYKDIQWRHFGLMH